MSQMSQGVMVQGCVQFMKFLTKHPGRLFVWLLITVLSSTANWPCYLCNADKQATIRMLVQSARLLEASNVTYALHEGTTLGACRDHDIFPSDTDADLILEPTFVFQKEDQFRSQLAEIGELELKDGTDYVMWPRGTNALGRTSFGWLIICLRHSQCKVPSVDFNNNAGEEMVSGFDGKELAERGYDFFKDIQYWPPVVLPGRCFIPSASILSEAADFNFPVANHPEHYLERVYGPTWRQQRQHFAIRACELVLKAVIPLLALVHLVFVQYFLWVRAKHELKGHSSEEDFQKLELLEEQRVDMHVAASSPGRAKHELPAQRRNWSYTVCVHLVTFLVSFSFLGIWLFFKLKSENPYKFKRIILGESEYNF